jgi:hypothetical protein
MKRLLFFLIVFVLFILFVKPIFAIDRVNCNMCGLCLDSAGNVPKPNSTQKACMDCIYPGIAKADTFKIKDDLPLQPALGKHYTMIGCINLGSGTGTFAQEGGAAGIANVVLPLIFKLAGAIAFLYIIYGAFLILTSQADPERLNYGKQIVLRSIIGLLVCLMSILIISFITSGILKIPGMGTESSP